jgi:hypothetical protein
LPGTLAPGAGVKVASWTFLTYHARVLLLVAPDPGVRLRDIAASLNITERSAFSIITDLVAAGYVIKEKNGRRNRYHVQAHLASRVQETGRHSGADGSIVTGTPTPRRRRSGAIRPPLTPDPAQ